MREQAVQRSCPAPIRWRLFSRESSFAEEIPAQGRFFFLVSVLLGLPVLGYSLLTALASEPTWLALAAAAVIASFFPVRLPSLHSRMQSCTMTAGDIFTFVTILLYSPEAAVAVAVIDSFVGSFKRSRPYRSIFNLAQVSILTFISGHLFYALQGSIEAGSPSETMRSLLFFVSLIGCASLYLASTTGAVSRMISLSTGSSFLETWKDNALSYSVTSVAGISLVGFIYLNFERAQFMAVGVALPVVLMVLYAYKMNHARVESLQKALVIAHYDPLTGLPNRKLFHDQIVVHLAQAEREDKALALLLLDLDNFKNVNDSLGHSAGDLLLRAVADRLKSTLRTSDVVARLGGDEFTVLVPGMTRDDPVKAAQVAEKILQCFEKPFHVDNREIYATTSIGVSLFPSDGQEVDRLMRHADMAMYRSKENGPNKYRFYSSELSARFQERLALETDLRHAVERDQLDVHYQPQVDLRSGRITGVEALVRWNHPLRGNVPPSIFVPIAEETGLIWQIGEQVLRRACLQGRKWVRAGYTDLRIAVNVSARQLKRSSLDQLVAEVLEESSLPAANLEIELTEGSIMEDVESAIQMLNRLSRLGVHIAIDDFGTGYSSLAYLKQFTLDRLKIDRSFIQDLGSQESKDAKITRTIIAMAHHLNLKVIAEGVETQDQLEFLHSNGCDEIQGYLCSRPLSSDDLDEFLARKRSSNVLQMPERCLTRSIA